MDTANLCSIPLIQADQICTPPNWALWQRRLIDIMNEAGILVRMGLSSGGITGLVWMVLTMLMKVFTLSHYFTL